MDSPLFRTVRAQSTHFVSVVTSKVLPDPSAYDIARAYERGEEDSLQRGEVAGSLTILPISVSSSQGLLVTSSEEVEDKIFSLVPQLQTRRVMLTNTLYPEEPNQLALQINHVANQIAFRTRRAAGNVVLVGWKTWHTLLRKELAVSSIEAGLDNRVGRWTHVGVVNSCLKVYAGDFIPSDEIFVAYVGGNQNLVDAPLGVLEHNGLYHYVEVPAMYNSTLISDYFGRIRYVA